MKTLQKFKYVSIGSIVTALAISGVSYSDDILETIHVKFTPVDLTGNVQTVSTNVMNYNDTYYIPLFDVANATGVNLSMGDEGIKITNYSLSANPPSKLTSYQSANAIYLNWNDTGADHYIVSYKDASSETYRYIPDANGDPRKMYWYPDYSLKFTGIEKGEVIDFVVTAVKDDDISKYSSPLSVTVNGASTQSTKQSIGTSTFDILLSKYSDESIVLSIVSNDKISKNADKSISNQSKWLRTFEETLSNKSSTTGGRINSYAVTEALKAANNSVK